MELILVDESDNPVGTMGKMEVHERALLHRAFSIFIFNHQGEMLLQKRAAEKYHSPGLWTNACCSHPSPDVPTAEAALTRLQEEMGFKTPLTKVFDFIYKASFDNGLTEHEFDHVYVGHYDGKIAPDPMEVSDYCYKSVDEIQRILLTNPAEFTVWFQIAFPKLLTHLANESRLHTTV
jgi:isopentenyl-diphosphate delta-isomerase